MRCADSIDCTALILCGGLGTRLRSVTGQLPKALAPVRGRPFLHYVFGYLRTQGIADIVLCTGYGAEQVAAQCGDGARFGVSLRYSQEPEPRGTAGAIKHAEALIGSSSFLVLNGDSIVPAALDRVTELHQQRGAAISMVLTAVADQARFGSVRLDDDGAILGFHEKGLTGPGLINAGIYLIERSVLADVPAGTNVSIERDVFPGRVGRGLYGVVTPGPFIDIGTPETYGEAPAFFADWQGAASA